MEQLTRDQLVEALTEYYQRFADTPEEFTLKFSNPKEDACAATELIFQIAEEQTQGV